MLEPDSHSSGPPRDAEQAWRALSRLLTSVDAVREGQAWYLLLSVFALAGLLLAMAEASFVRSDWPWATLQAASAFFVVFYGSNAAGSLMMDRAAGRPARDLSAAVRDALLRAHRLLGVVLVIGLSLALGAALLVGLLWVCRLPLVGPVLYALVVPVAVLSVGLALVAGAVVVVPLAAPAIWSGATTRQALATLWAVARQRLMMAAVLLAGLGLLTGLAGAVASSVVWLGGGLVAELSVRVIGVQVPPSLLMAGLFGRGLRSVSGVDVPPEAVAHTSAALIGGGVVFALALVLPGLVYLRGICTVYLSLREAVGPAAPAGDEGPGGKVSAPGSAGA